MMPPPMSLTGFICLFRSWWWSNARHSHSSPCIAGPWLPDPGKEAACRLARTSATPQRPNIAAACSRALIHDGAMGGVSGGTIGRVVVVAPGFLHLGLRRRAVLVHLHDQGDDEAGLIPGTSRNIPVRPYRVAYALDLLL